MVEQDSLDNIPEAPTKEFYKIIFHEINEKNGEIRYKLIAGQYISLNCLEFVKYFADPYLILFGNPLNIQFPIKILINERSKKTVPKSEEAFCRTDKGSMDDIASTDLKEQDLLEKNIEMEIKEALLKSKISFDDLKQPTGRKY